MYDIALQQVGKKSKKPQLIIIQSPDKNEHNKI